MTKKGELVVEVARDWLGTPYRHQASRQGVGCDCLGLVRGVWRELFDEEIAPVPPYAQFSRDVDGASHLLSAAQKYLSVGSSKLNIGQMLLFQLHPNLPPRHCGILVGENRFVHAQERLGVIEVYLTPQWQRRIHSNYDFPTRVIT